MALPWTAEREVSPELARTLIEAQFSELAPAHLEPFGVGFDNTAYLVGARFVFRFPRRQLGADLLDVECAVLPHLAGRLPLPAPHPQFVGEPTGAYPWRFAGYPLLPGRTACVAALDDRARTRLAEPLARFLAALHRVPANQAHAWGAPPDTLGRLDLQKRVPMARTYLDRVHQLGLVADVRPLLTFVDDVAQRQEALSEDAASAELPLSLLHGDLYARHLLVDARGRLCGVIDWGDVHAGRVATDLMIAHAFLPPSAHDLFRSAYGPIAEADWQLARLRAVYHSAIVAVYAHDVGDGDLLRESLTALRYLASPSDLT